MAYTKTEWKDQVVENPRTYSMRDNGDNTVTLLDAFGTVTELGTPVNAANMNHIEDGIAAVEALANTKQAAITGAASTITGSNLTTNRALTSNGSGKVAVSDTTATELGYVHGVTSNIQTQLNAKQSSSDVSTAITNMLKALFPVGSIYIGTQNTCPLATLISGSTWQLVAQDRALWGGNGSNGNSTINAGLPNISGNIRPSVEYTGSDYADGAFNRSAVSGLAVTANFATRDMSNYKFDASRSNSIYGKSSTVQPPAYRVNVWRRTA